MALLLLAKSSLLQEQIETILRKSAGRLNINNADERKVIKYRKEVLNSPEFEALWQRICQKTLYRLAFDEDELIKSCTKSLSEMQPVAKAMVSFSKATIKQSQSGLDVKLSLMERQALLLMLQSSHCQIFLVFYRKKPD
jgi:type III restriction enzyme